MWQNGNERNQDNGRTAMSGKRPSLAESMRQAVQADPEPVLPPTPAPIAPRTPARAAPAPVRVAAKAEPAAPRPSGFYAATRAGKKKVTAALDPATHKRLKALGVEREATTEALLQEAIADLFRKYG